MNTKIPIVLAVLALMITSLACQALAGGGAGGNPPAIPTEPQPVSGEIFIRDDFTSDQWGTSTDTDSSVEYANGTLQVIVYTGNYFVWSTPNDQDYQDVHMEVTVVNNNTDSTTAFGLMCDQQAGDNDAFYYLAITPAGEYAIAKAVPGQDDLFLTNNDAWGQSAVIPEDAASYRLGADCGRGRLTLYVNGQQVDSVSDPAYSSGGVGVIVWSGEDATSTNVAFDDFLLAGMQ